VAREGRIVDEHVYTERAADLKGARRNRRTASAEIGLDRADAFVGWVLRHGGILWLFAALLAVPAIMRTAALYTHLRSEIEQLLPVDAPSVRAIDELRERMPGLQYLGVVVDSGTKENLPAAERFIDDLAAHIRRYPSRLVRSVRTDDADERSFFEANAPLYADLSDLRAIRTQLEARRDYEVSKQFDSLLDEDAPAPPLKLDALLGRYEQAIPPHRFDHHRFSNEKLHLTLLLIQLGDFDTGRSRGQELVERVRSDIAGLGGPEHYAPGMRIGFAGDVAISVEETSALVADLTWSSVVVIALVVAVILLYYRWWPSIVALGSPLLLATLYAFAVASLPPWSIEELNSNTAFLGSIIVGNGINFGIVFLARYVEGRRAGSSLRHALARATGGTYRATLCAALAAGASYASLALTDFRGFRQFGVIGCLGMVFSWAGAFVLMPPLLAYLERKGVRPPRAQQASFAALAWFGRVLEAHPLPFVAASIVLTVLSVSKATSFDWSQIETDFSRLRRADTWHLGEGYWGRRMEALLGSYLTPSVILTDDVQQARDIESALRRTPAAERIASIRTIDDLIPSNQSDKLRELSSIREDLTPKMFSLLSEDQRRVLDRLTPETPLRAVVPADLPERLLAGLRERDGTLGREVLVFPRPSRQLWQGGPLVDFVGSLRQAARSASGPRARPGRVAGSLPLSADIVVCVQRDGPRACAAALLGVFAIVLVLQRPSRESLLVLGSLSVAIVWLIAGAMALGIRINFANFIAYPITFGIGVDYAINIVGRYRERPLIGVGSVLRGTGSAVALCSLTTITGYSSLLMAQNRGLFRFGAVAVLGEVCCLSTAIILVPALLQLIAQKRPFGVAKGRRRPRLGLRE
jgi:predicted RND superfamily exporter protein